MFLWPMYCFRKPYKRHFLWTDVSVAIHPTIYETEDLILAQVYKWYGNDFFRLKVLQNNSGIHLRNVYEQAMN